MGLGESLGWGAFGLEVRLGGSWRGVFGLEVRLAGVWWGGAISKWNGQGVVSKSLLCLGRTGDH